MKNEKKNKDMEYWLAMSERYFDAQATDEEEKELLHFLASNAAKDPAFNEIKAVMGYLHTGRSVARKEKSLNRRTIDKAIQWASIAACAAAIAIIGTSIGQHYTESEEIYYAYIDGEEYTDEEFVMQNMLATMNKMSNTSDNIVEEQLGAMLRIK